MSQVAFAPDVFTWPSDEPQLIGGRCTACAAVAFPQPNSCAALRVDRGRAAPARPPGTLYTWTTQDFLPKEPYASGETLETFRPFGVGLVELGGEVRVEARLTESDPELLDFGMEVELAIVPFREDDDGTEVMTYTFAPVRAHEGE